MKRDRQKAACDYLMTLSTSKSLELMIVNVLLGAVADVADQLSRASAATHDDDTDDAGLPACWQLENVAYVLDCSERVLATTKDRDVAVELRRRLSSQLDLSLCHVASAFPLFAYRVWQLGHSLQRAGVNVDDSKTPD